MNPIILFKNLRIKYKLLLAYFIVPLIFILGIGYVCYLSSTDALTKQSHHIIYQAQQNTIAEIIKNLNRYEFMANTIYSNTKIQQLMSDKQLDPYIEYDIVKNVLTPSIQSILDASGGGLNVQLIRYNDHNSEIIQDNVEGVLRHTRPVDFYLGNGHRQFQLINHSRVMDLPWVQAARAHPGAGAWAQVGDDERYNYISFLHEITDESTYRFQKVALLRLTIAVSAIHSEDMSNPENVFNLLVHDRGQLLSSEPDKVAFYKTHESLLDEFMGSPATETLLSDQGIILIKSQPFNEDWHLISIFPMSYIQGNVSKIREVTILCFILSGGLLFLMTLFLSGSFSKRIIRIAAQMQQFSPGKFNMKLKSSGRDEIEFLDEAFQDMTQQISTLIQDNYQSNIDKKDALLTALQAQINPHFLYNSMSSIAHLADLGETDDIITMVHALTIFYRMTLNRGRETITIADELAQVKAYLDVFRIRKGEMFSVTYDVDEAALPYCTIKVILQPFVENIFEHAMNIDDSVVHITISVHIVDDCILFTIADDGMGIPPDKMATLFASEHTEGYGVRNVNERIELQFGKEYGVNIESTLGQGTTVRILIPKLAQ